MKLLYGIRRLIFTVLMAEVLYLLLFNGALNLDLTQKLINKIKPEKFQITWEKAWTPYPFKVYMEDASARDASSSPKWKVKVHQATARVSL